MELLNLVVEAALATGLVGYLGSRAWRWWRRPRLTICVEAGQHPEMTMRRAFLLPPPHLTAVVQYRAVVRNEGRATARSVEAVMDRTATWDGERWRPLDDPRAPRFLVWSGTRETRTHLPPDDRGRRLALFIAGPVGEEDRWLIPATPADYDSQAPPTEGFAEGRSRVRIEVTPERGEPASCELEVEWDSGRLRELGIEGDCVRPSC